MIGLPKVIRSLLRVSVRIVDHSAMGGQFRMTGLVAAAIAAAAWLLAACTAGAPSSRSASHASPTSTSASSPGVPVWLLTRSALSQLTADSSVSDALRAARLRDLAARAKAPARVRRGPGRHLRLRGYARADDRPVGGGVLRLHFGVRQARAAATGGRGRGRLSRHRGDAATASDVAPTARVSVRLTARMDWNTCSSFAADGRISSGGSRGPVWPGGGGTVRCGTVYKRPQSYRHRLQYLNRY